jgi:molybdate transport system permease protein
MIDLEDLAALALSLQLALTSTAVLLLLATPLAWWLSRTQWRGRAAIEALVALPLVLPPTVLGFYLLIALGPDGPGAWLGLPPLAFTYSGLVIGSVIYSLPFVVQPLRDAFAASGVRVMEVAACLRAGPWDRFFNLALPLARPGFITAAVLGFAHTLGEFGVVLMIGGNIPGQTRVASIAVYDHVEQLNWGAAHALSLLLLALSFCLLVLVYTRRQPPRMWPA